MKNFISVSALLARSRATSAPELCVCGFEQLAAGNAAEAEQSFRAALQVDFEHIDAHHGLLRAFCDQGRYRQAVDVGLALIILAPHDSLAHIALAGALRQAGLSAEANKALDRARELERDSSEPQS